MIADRPVPTATVGDDHPLARLEAHLIRYYRRTLDYVTPTDTPGYWRAVTECDGCTHPCGGHYPNGCGQTHTYRFLDDRRGPDGQWASPYRTWWAARDPAALPAGGR